LRKQVASETTAESGTDVEGANPAKPEVDNAVGENSDKQQQADLAAQGTEGPPEYETSVARGIIEPAAVGTGR
jgi:hypothetical protein